MAASAEKTYTVTVTETKTWEVQVHASSSEEAKDLVEGRHETCEDYDVNLLVDNELEFEVESEHEEEDMSLCVNLSGTKEEAWKVLEEYERQLQQACAAAEQMDKVINRIGTLGQGARVNMLWGEWAYTDGEEHVDEGGERDYEDFPQHAKAGIYEERLPEFQLREWGAEFQAPRYHCRSVSSLMLANLEPPPDWVLVMGSVSADKMNAAVAAVGTGGPAAAQWLVEQGLA